MNKGKETLIYSRESKLITIYQNTFESFFPQIYFPNLQGLAGPRVHFIPSISQLPRWHFLSTCPVESISIPEYISPGVDTSRIRCAIQLNT